MSAGALRGWCPGLARPMPTGDGLLVRLHPAGGVLDAAQARAVADAARAGGNGLVDVTARGNLQIRGVTAATHPALAAALAAAGLGDARRDGGPQRLTLAPPFAGPACAALARRIEAIGRGVPGLPAKALVILEEAAGGLGAAEADLRVRCAAAGPVRIALAAPDGLAWTRPVAADEAPAALRRLLEGLAASGARRVRALSAPERGALAGAASLAPGDPPPPAAPPLGPGLHALADGRTALVAELPFGRCGAGLLARMARWCARHGDGALRLTAARGVAVACPDAAAAGRLRDAVGEAGLIVAPGDPRGAVAACPGAPACASGGTPAQADAGRLAAAFAPLAARGATLHVSGCPKGCAHPGAADLTLVGQADGGYRVVLGGDAGAPTALALAFEAVRERLESVDDPSGLRDAFREPA
ncbi:hypothetical protein OPKNFCMD_3684 [Methylobacterium crusticola]|uniref:Nitrite/Sulfite reductase ferredoxin-like domain-containing protein n=1 Tax=Methylobacterium crusticola TaxID=1697972 RepID=A0ABQ4R1B6_9HYPH|nr:nitrite reductase [Methylobacterium crusticola]GJD50934.1 hypothetical protein OPKNFCMD_3684 [Methylobacterium crusticola]